jgi:steroid delta-isomerase-like uncharacterized protein
MNATHKELIQRYFDEVWSAGDMHSQEQLVAPDYTGYWLIAGMPVREGPEGHRAWLNNVRTAMPDLRYSIEDIVVGEGKAVARVRLAGTNTGPMAGRAPTGKHATVEQIFVFHLARDQIQQEWVSFDRASFMQQLEVVSG